MTVFFIVRYFRMTGRNLDLTKIDEETMQQYRDYNNLTKDKESKYYIADMELPKINKEGMDATRIMSTIEDLLGSKRGSCGAPLAWVICQDLHPINDLDGPYKEGSNDNDYKSIDYEFTKRCMIISQSWKNNEDIDRRERKGPFTSDFKVGNAKVAAVLKRVLTRRLPAPIS